MKNRILICDDDLDILEVTSIILKNKGYEIETLSRLSEEVLTTIRDFRPNLILMDLRMPGMNGERAIQMIKTDDSIKNIPVVLFSANTQLNRISEEVNADGVITKPFNIRELIKQIEKYVHAEV